MAPAPLYAENHDESGPSPLTALRAARLFLAKAADQRSTDQVQVTRLLGLDPVMPLTYRQVQAFCRMIRERRGEEFDAWVAAVQQTGVKELRGFVKGLLKDAAAVRAGLSLIWSNGPTEGFIHRLKLLKRQAYGRASVDFLRRHAERRSWLSVFSQGGGRGSDQHVAAHQNPVPVNRIARRRHP